MIVKFVQPYARLDGGCEDGVAALRRIERIGRISHRAEEKMTPDSFHRFIPAVVLEHGDWSITEHASASVEFLVDRGTSHEIVRHRIASYTQESQRFVNYGKRGSIEAICPLITLSNDEGLLMQWITESVQKYEHALNTLQLKPQIARALLPNAIATKLVMTANLRSWRNFLIKRSTAETHPELRRVVDPLLKDFQFHFPYLYADILPGERQAKALKKGM